MQAKNLVQGILVLSTAAILSACGNHAGSTPTATSEIANPASAFCTQHGGRVELRNSQAGEYAVCVFKDKSECDEWAYYRGACQPGQFTTAPTPTARASK